MSHEVKLKSLPKQWFASRREVIPTYSDVTALIAKVVAHLGPSISETVMPAAIWHDAEYKPSDVDAEAGCLLRNSLPPIEGIEIYELPEVTAAATTYNGSYQNLPQAYGAIMGWLRANGYQPAGPARELYIHCPGPIRPDDESYITEIQMPVTRAG